MSAQSPKTHAVSHHQRSFHDMKSSTIDILTSTNKPVLRWLSYFTFIQVKWAEFSKPHVCGLIDTMRDNPIVNELVDTGLFIKFRRRLKKIFMISKKHPYTKIMFKSLSEIRREEIRHLLNHRPMIHPFSEFCMYWEFIMAAFHIFYLVYVVSDNLAYLSPHYIILWVKFACDVIMTIHIIISFYIGYWDKEKMIVVMNQKLVVKHYIRTFFVWDMLSCIPSYCLVIYFYVFKNIRTFTKWFCMCRMARIISIDNAMNIFRIYYGIPQQLHVALIILLKSYWVVLSCMACVALIGHIPYFLNPTGTLTQTRRLELAEMTIFETIKTVFAVNDVETSDHYFDAISCIFFHAVAFILSVWIMAKLYILWQRFLILSEVDEDHYQQLSGFLKYKGLPPNLRQEIYCYYEFNFQKRYYDESAILRMLTDNLKKDIPSYRLDKNIEKIEFLQIMSNAMIRHLVDHMEISYYCPGDVVFRVGTASSILYYVKCGTVALHDENEKEVCHLGDGSFYGDISVTLNQIHLVTMTAIAPCRLFKLKQSVLMDVLDKSPLVKEKVIQLSKELLMNRQMDWYCSTNRDSEDDFDSPPISTNYISDFSLA